MKNRLLLWQLFPANLLITWFGASAVRVFYFNQMQDGLVSRGRLIENQVSRLLVTSPDKLQKWCQQVGRRAGTRLTVVRPDETVRADSNEDPGKMNNHANRPELQSALHGTIGSSVRFSRTLQENMLYVAVPLVGLQGESLGALRLSVPVTSLTSVLNVIYLKIFAGCFLVVIVAALVTLYVSRKISRPLEEMKLGAERMASGEMYAPLTVNTEKSSLEVAGLATSLNRMAREIDERIQTITLQHNELETVFASMAEMILVIDTDKKILRINRATAALFYLSPDDVQGKLLHGVIRDNDLHKIVDQVLTDGYLVEKDIAIYIGPDRLYLQTRAVPLRDGNNNPAGVLVVLNDMTRLYKLENMRREFVANVSHELKTPVTSIRGYVETLLDGAWDDPKDAKRFFETVSRQASRLDAIIDDLLMLSRIEQKTDQHDITRSRARIMDIFDTAVQACQGLAAEKNIAIETTCDDNLHVRASQNLLEQAIINLLTNALMYTNAGSTVEIHAARDDSSCGNRVVLSVKDQGTGIAQEHHGRLF